MVTKYFQTDIIDQIPGYFIVKDLHSRYLAANSTMAHYLGYEHSNDTIGITDYDVRPELVENAKDFIKQDKRVIQKNKQVQQLDICSFPHEALRIFLTDRKPLVTNKEVAGTILHATEINVLSLKKFSALLLQHDQYFLSNKNICVSYDIETNYKHSNLSPRESECLFYLLRGNSNQAIADIFDISKRTVETYIERIKAKMGCHSRAEIIEKSIELGYLLVIPPTIYHSAIHLQR